MKLFLEIFYFAEEQSASLMICCLKRNTCELYSDIYGHEPTDGMDSTPKGTWFNPKNTMGMYPSFWRCFHTPEATSHVKRQASAQRW